MKTKFFGLALMGALLIGSTACSEKEEEGDGAVDVDNMTVEEQKEYVGTVAEEVSNMLSVPAVKNNIEFLNYVAETYGLFEDDYYDDDYYYAPKRSGSRGYSTVQFADATGIYRWNGSKFERTGNADDLTVIVPNDPKYREIVLKVKASKDVDKVEVNDYGDVYIVEVPHTIEGNITANGQVMMSQKVTSSGLNGSTAKVNNVTTIGALVVNGNGEVGSTSATATSTMSVSGANFATANTTVTGVRLNDAQNWVNGGAENIKTVAGTGDVLNKVQIKFNANASKIYNLDDWFSYGPWNEYQTGAEALEACNLTRDIYNSAVTGYFTFNNTDKKQAYLTYISYQAYDYYYQEEGYRYGAYAIEPTMKFADDSTITDETFNGVFNAIMNQWEFLFK